MYKGIKCSPFKQMKDEIPRILKPNGIVITFGYHSVVMGKTGDLKLKKSVYFLMAEQFMILLQALNVTKNKN